MELTVAARTEIKRTHGSGHASKTVKGLHLKNKSNFRSTTKNATSACADEACEFSKIKKTGKGQMASHDQIQETCKPTNVNQADGVVRSIRTSINVCASPCRMPGVTVVSKSESETNPLTLESMIAAAQQIESKRCHRLSVGERKFAGQSATL